MVIELPITRERVGRGGDRHPLSVKNFILEYLVDVRQDYIASMHRAYKEQLDLIARSNGRPPYHKPSYHSFCCRVQELTREGRIRFSGREEPSDSPHFDQWPEKPMRRYYELVA